QIEGMAFDETRVVVPAQTGTSDGNGDAYFPNLGALPWRITIRKPGYRTTTAIWRCTKQSWDANQCDTFRVGTGPGGSTSYRGWLSEISPPWNPGSLRIDLTSPYLNPQF